MFTVVPKRPLPSVPRHCRTALALRSIIATGAKATVAQTPLQVICAVLLLTAAITELAPTDLASVTTVTAAPIVRIMRPTPLEKIVRTVMPAAAARNARTINVFVMTVTRVTRVKLRAHLAMVAMTTVLALRTVPPMVSACVRMAGAVTIVMV